MVRIAAALFLTAVVFTIASCCSCWKDAHSTWGPGLMHWGNGNAATQPAQ